MFDFDLQMRFTRSVMDAWLGYATAGAAALSEWHKNADSRFAAPVQAALPFDGGMPANPFLWWTKMMFPGQQASFPAADFGASFFQFASPGQFGALPSATQWQNGWTEMLQNCCWAWPQVSWGFFQAPMTAMLMSAGLPYSVAAPTARANAASMDAVDAARQGMDKWYASFRTDGGHGFVPPASWQNLMLIMLAPWLAALPAASAAQRLF